MFEGIVVLGIEGGLLEVWYGRMVVGDIFVFKEMLRGGLFENKGKLLWNCSCGKGYVLFFI